MQMTKPGGISAEQYFELERTSETKSEYFRGDVFAMTGASVRHNMIVSNVIAALANAFAGMDCHVFPSDIKVEVDPDRHYAYPDASVVCGEIQTPEDRNDAISNPVVIVEVLSASTADYDRGSKFKAYRKLASLNHFITIDQYSVSVEHHRKESPGNWNMRELESIDGTLHFEDFGISVPLDKIYYHIKF